MAYHGPADGVFEAKCNTDVDLYSVILPYAERRKYTLGEKYVSWETQGDFIFVKAQRPQWNYSFGLEILCDLDSFWIKPVQGNMIFKNGKKIDDREKTRLDFGDELTFIKNFNNVSSGGLASFTFKKREYPTNWDNSNKSEQNCGLGGSVDAIFTPDQNQLIFSHILSFLPLGSLKNARLVCKHWDEQVTPILRKKSVINFHRHRQSSANPSLKMLRYIHEMQNWPNWRISYPALPAKEEDNKNFGAKYILDLEMFLKPQRGHHVKTLSLVGCIHSVRDYWLFVTPVIQFCDTLEELRLDFGLHLDEGYENEKGFYSWIGNPNPPTLLKLKKFWLKMNLVDEEVSQREMAAQWMTDLARAIKRVESISTLGDVSLGSRFVQGLKTNGTSSYKNLREVLLTCEPSDGISFLTELNNQPLKKLTLTIPLEKRHLPEFENLLKKFAPSLELLSFRVSTEGLEPKSRFVLNLPEFPNLKSLDLHFGTFQNVSDYDEPSDMGCFIENVPRLWLAFSPPGRGDDDLGGINYERHLPSIRYIILTPYILHREDMDYFWPMYSDLIDSLLPKKGGQSCKTLQRLELPDLEDIAIKTGYAQAHRLAGIFPNVRNEWMTDLRVEVVNN